MPTYEFRCPNGHDFERFYKTMSTAVAELECPECGALAMRQLSAGAGLHFKGSGFYLTDYGRNAHRAAPKVGDGGDGGGGGGGGGDGGDAGTGEGSKPEPKPAPVEARPKSEAPAAPKADSAKPAKPAKQAKPAKPRQ